MSVYSDYTPKPYTYNLDPTSPSYPFRPKEGMGQYIDGYEIAYQDVWNGEDLQIKRQNDYMKAIAEREAMEQSRVNTAAAQSYLSQNPPGPLGLRTDLRIPTREAAVNWHSK